MLVDLSKSTFDSGARPMYADHYRKIISALEYGDSLVVFDISADSVVKGRILQEYKMPAPEINPGDTQEVQEADRILFESENPIDQLRAEAESPDVLKEIEQAQNPGSDVFGALKLAARQFSYVPDDDRFLVVLSDMIAATDGLNMSLKPFAPPGAWTQSDTDDWIAPRKERLPDLGGVHVLVAGAAGFNDEHEGRIRDFWSAYFAATGASLNANDYGNQLSATAIEALKRRAQ